MIKKNKSFCAASKLYWAALFFLVSAIIRCIPISAFASLVGIPIRIASFAVGLKIV